MSGEIIELCLPAELSQSGAARAAAPPPIAAAAPPPAAAAAPPPEGSPRAAAPPGAPGEQHPCHPAQPSSRQRPRGASARRSTAAVRAGPRSAPRSPEPRALQPDAARRAPPLCAAALLDNSTSISESRLPLTPAAKRVWSPPGRHAHPRDFGSPRDASRAPSLQRLSTAASCRSAKEQQLMEQTNRSVDKWIEKVKAQRAAADASREAEQARLEAARSPPGRREPAAAGGPALLEQTARSVEKWVERAREKQQRARPPTPQAIRRDRAAASGAALRRWSQTAGDAWFPPAAEAPPGAAGGRSPLKAPPPQPSARRAAPGARRHAAPAPAPPAATEPPPLPDERRYSALTPPTHAPATAPAPAPSTPPHSAGVAAVFAPPSRAAAAPLSPPVFAAQGPCGGWRCPPPPPAAAPPGWPPQWPVQARDFSPEAPCGPPSLAMERYVSRTRRWNELQTMRQWAEPPACPGLSPRALRPRPDAPTAGELLLLAKSAEPDPGARSRSPRTAAQLAADRRAAAAAAVADAVRKQEQAEAARDWARSMQRDRGSAGSPSAS
eukprot:TRINITY_DN6805_c1_g1_i1.p1 TRINITY_DN6805_c1_g1~~TRINITY_DN6805_c1_g1_i1.p1  ORF type:complete len:554 (+),score=111.74 TRINITY_DN6805_c1_g1_i1:67-1728(+)